MKLKNNKNRLMVACLLAVWNITAHADILTDGTVGDIYYLFGDNMIIPENYGTRVGDNLFHSFSMFNIYSGEAVTFTGSNTLQNVIARVTGGEASMINGILSSNIGKANFYFINPAGVTFGKNAVVDVPAAFHVSTANQINFADGSVYSATNPAASTLTIAKPESFGFLGQTGDIVLDGAQIVAKPNQTIDLVANNIVLKNEAVLAAFAGELRLVAAKGSQNVSLVRNSNGFLPLPNQMPNNENAGTLMIENSIVDTSGNGAGRISVWGNNILLKSDTNGYGIFADNTDSTDAGVGKGVNIQANLLTLDKSWICSDSYGEGASGSAGSVNINAENLTIRHGGIISSSSFSTGNANSVKITANRLKIDGQESNDLFTGITTQVGPNSKGTGGNIIINTENLEILNGGQISSSTFSQGKAGDVTIFARQLKIDAQGNNRDVTGIVSVASGTGAEGHAGNITVNAENLNIFNEGQISSSTYSPANAGNVNIFANQLKIDGQGSSSFTGITSQATFSNSGNAGSVTVKAKSLDILNGGEINSSTWSQGDAGSVNITANQLKIAGDGSSINSASFGKGNAGNIFISAHILNVENNGFITTFANAGNGGNITINAKDYLYLENSAITTTTYGATSNGGNININTPALVMNTGLIQANAEGGQGGDIGLNIQALIPSYNSLIIGGEQVSWQSYIPGFNVIQAASANGVNGTVNISSPQFDISGSLSGLKNQALEPPVMSRNPCDLGGSSLKRKGKGGLPVNETKTGFISPVTKLPNSANNKSETASQNIPTSESQKPCAASVI